MSRDASRVAAAVGAVTAVALAAACQPTVRVVAPSEPIEINLNVTMDIRLRLDPEVDQMIADNPDLFG